MQYICSVLQVHRSVRAKKGNEPEAVQAKVFPFPNSYPDPITHSEQEANRNGETIPFSIINANGFSRAELNPFALIFSPNVRKK
jgi:hypothetical protein